MMQRQRPKLNPIPLRDAIKPGQVTVTMGRGQWDALLQAAYDAGHVLLELDDNERPRAAYRKALP